jgi:hypothetical protein
MGFYILLWMGGWGWGGGGGGEGVGGEGGLAKPDE